MSNLSSLTSLSKRSATTFSTWAFTVEPIRKFSQNSTRRSPEPIPAKTARTMVRRRCDRRKAIGSSWASQSRAHDATRAILLSACLNATVRNVNKRHGRSFMKFRNRRTGIRLLAVLCTLVVTLLAQEKVDLTVVNKIKGEAFQNSQVMDHLFYLTDVYGPRLTNSPGHRA